MFGGLDAWATSRREQDGYNQQGVSASRSMHHPR